ncbi:SH3 domain-containing protein [Tropicimonas sp. IMCC34011]|uniref:SH3 domain-containing protein n=1 Tax=Tropicimonas sp. IMCC34011 TaxID=2248759 RepID=UPI001E64FF6A|nr:SH3 domain-containing protein [Tropicimonas sp. IMCC34011]
MLGKYVAGTLLVLGGAMLIVPETGDVDVTRAATAPSALAAPVVQASAEPADLDQARNIVQAAVQGSVGAKPAVASDAPDSAAQAEANPSGTLELSDETRRVLAAAGGVVDADRDWEALAADPAADAQMLEVSGSRVNVRSGPSTGHGVIDSLVRGTDVELVSEDASGWAKIRMSGGREGYMARRFLDEIG